MDSVDRIKQDISSPSNAKNFLDVSGEWQDSIIVSGTTDLSANVSSVESIYEAAIAKHHRGDLVGAEQNYRDVIAVKPDHAGAWHFLGVIALLRKDYQKARDQIEHALSLCNTNAVYYNNYGVVLKSTGCLNEAEASFEKAIALNGKYADAWSNFGQVLFLLKQDDQCIEHALGKALALVPNHPDALSHLAELRNRQERHAEGAEILKKILPNRPNYVALLCRIAESFALAKRYSEALEFQKRAVALLPGNAVIQQRLGDFHGETGEILQAKECFRAAVLLPKGKPSWRWKHLGYCPVYFDNAQQIDDYWQQLHRDLDEAIAENNVYDWKTLVYHGFTPSFHLPHHNRCCREVKEKFTKLFAGSFPFERPKRKYPHRKSGKIRVGFLVTPGHEGGFIRYTGGIIERLDPKRFEIILLYHEVSSTSFQRIAQENRFTHVTFNWNFEQSVTKIKETDCDIIYFWKVGADVWNFFLPMARLAPIQFTSWGTHGTSGVEHIDYSLSYDLAEIETAQEHYTETLFLMKEAPAFQPRMQLPQTFSRQELGLPETGAIYYCPHRLSKYHPDYDFYLKGILELDPNGHLLLLLGDPSPQSEKFKERMRRHLGDTLFKRIIFIPKQPPRRYNQLMAAATMILDSPIYSGGITAYDAMSYGVPSVTQAGQLLIQRYPVSSYKAMGIDGPITNCREEYIRAAVRLGTDHDYHQYFSDLIRERNHLIFERSEVVLEFETFFETILENFRNLIK